MTPRTASGVFITALFIVACASPPPHGPHDGCREPGAMRKPPGESPAAMAERRLVALKPQLDLQPGQEKAWEDMLTSICESGKAMEATRTERRGPPPPSEMENVRIATDRFYASLSAEQREIMDRNMPRPPPPCLDDGPPPGRIYGKPPGQSPQ